jgi:hypothetical protein
MDSPNNPRDTQVSTTLVARLLLSPVAQKVCILIYDFHFILFNSHILFALKLVTVLALHCTEQQNIFSYISLNVY